MPTINIIGCGKVGKTLAKLWVEQKSLQIESIVNASYQSAEKAVVFLGSGSARATISECRPADFYMIATPDRFIEQIACELKESSVIQSGAVVFHCSGALSSHVLSPLTSSGASVASIHPVKSFAEGANSIATFKGTFCGIEGDAIACAALSNLLEEIGAQIFAIESHNKLLYHAANVFACNYLTALLELAIRGYVESGIDRATAMQIMEPIVRETINNIFKLGTTTALTGPIARGDFQLINTQLTAVTEWYFQAGELYRMLGQIALELSKQQGNLSNETLNQLKTILHPY